MSKLINILSKVLAAVLFIGLLAVNVQIGSGTSYIDTGLVNTQVDQAQADWCNPMPVYCTIDIFGNIIWGDKQEWIPRERVQ